MKIESAHTKDTPRGSTAMMSLEDSERAKSGKYVGVLENSDRNDSGVQEKQKSNLKGDFL